MKILLGVYYKWREEGIFTETRTVPPVNEMIIFQSKFPNAFKFFTLSFGQSLFHVKEKSVKYNTRKFLYNTNQTTRKNTLWLQENAPSKIQTSA